MKQGLLSKVTFLLLFSLVFTYFNSVFKKTEMYENTKEDFISLSKQTNIDVIFFGSSHAYTTFNPLIINNQSNTISYNLGSKALRLPFSELVFEEAIKYTKPKLIILEAHYTSVKLPIKKSNKMFQLLALDFVPNYSLKKITTVTEAYNLSELPAVFFPLIRNHKNWHENKYFDLSRKLNRVEARQQHYYCGYMGSLKSIQSDTLKMDYQDFKKKETHLELSKSTLSKDDKYYLMRFIKKARDNDIKLLIVSIPTIHAKYYKNNFFNALADYCDNANVKYLNFNNLQEELGLDINDFRDIDHLNTYGGIKVSEYLAEYININYSLPDRSSEDTWGLSNKLYTKFEKDYGDYEDEIFMKQLNFELINDILIEDITITRNNKRHFFELNLNESYPFEKSIHNYKLGIHLVPKQSDIEFLNNESKSIGRNFEVVNIKFDGNDDKFSFEIYTKIRNIKGIRLFLYDKNGYNGVLGKAITVEDILFQ